VNKQPLQPHAYSQGAPPSPPAETPPAVESDADRRFRIDAAAEAAVRTNAVIFGLRYELRTTKDDNERERKATAEIIRNLKRENERLRQDLTAAYYNQHAPCDAPTAKKRKEELLEAVRTGKFCRGSQLPSKPTVPASSETPKSESETPECQKN
jgi:hypothetical protein